MTEMLEVNRRPRVLLVEDDRSLREALRDMLVDEGVEVVGEAGDGGEGVDLAIRLHPDVVLMDLRMPVMCGLEATKRIKESLPSTQVVILTAYEDPALKDGAREVDVYAYLVKGCPPSLVSDVTRMASRMHDGLNGNQRD
jgi:DNA-binding NarL/FixJ family response regulator